MQRHKNKPANTDLFFDEMIVYYNPKHSFDSKRSLSVWTWALLLSVFFILSCANKQNKPKHLPDESFDSSLNSEQVSENIKNMPMASTEDAYQNNEVEDENLAYYSNNEVNGYSKDHFFKALYMGNIYVDRKLILKQSVSSWQALSDLTYQNGDQADVLQKINKHLPKKGQWYYAASLNQIPASDYQDTYSEARFAQNSEGSASNYFSQNNDNPYQACSGHCPINAGIQKQSFPICCAYEVKRGDTLSNIAWTFYGQSSLWPKLYQRNKQTIGDNPNLIFPKQILNI